MFLGFIQLESAKQLVEMWVNIAITNQCLKHELGGESARAVNWNTLSDPCHCLVLVSAPEKKSLGHQTFGELCI